MADAKISNLPAASTPLAGSEVLPIVQSGATKQVSVDNLTAGKTVSASGVTVTGLTASKAVFTDASKNLTTTGTVGTAQGGTGLTSFTANGVVYASSTSALATGSAFTFDGTNPTTTGTFTGAVIQTFTYSVSTAGGAQNLFQPAAQGQYMVMAHDNGNRTTASMALVYGADLVYELYDAAGVFTWAISGGYVTVNGGSRTINVGVIRIR